MRLSNIGWNLLGLGTPLFIAFLTVPPLIRIIGMERFGLLALAWGLIGIGGVFDLGIGRATTQFVAQLRGQNSGHQIPSVIQAAIRLTMLSGFAGCLLLSAAALLGAQRIIHHSQALSSELTLSIYILAVSIPAQAVSATYRGVSEAFENFRGISLLRMVLGALNFLGPYLIAQVTVNLGALVGSLLISRLFALFVFRALAMRGVSIYLGRDASPQINIDTVIRKRLFAFGGWFFLSSIVSPLLMLADRFVIGAVLSATAVAAYTIPYEVVVRGLIIVGAITSVLFPRLTHLLHQESIEWEKVFHRWLRLVAAIMFVVTTALAIVLPVILPLWIGTQLPADSVLTGQVLCIGVFANSLGSMYFALLHAKGNSKITAQFHLIELPIFIGALYCLLHWCGIYGAAWAWSGRMVMDAVLLAAYFKYRYANNP